MAFDDDGRPVGPDHTGSSNIGEHANHVGTGDDATASGRDAKLRAVFRTSRSTLRPRHALALGVILITTALGAVACSDPDRSASRFCGELAVDLPLLGGPFADGGDVDDLVDRYERLDRITPLAIDDEWHALTELVRLASEVDVADPESRQQLADTAYKTERSARDVAIWVETTCGLAMPDVVGVEGSVPVNIPTTMATLPPMPDAPVTSTP
ncbi:MAG: hypothetical protein ACO37X_07430 [Ilumatobacteraceae bacterium]